MGLSGEEGGGTLTMQDRAEVFPHLFASIQKTTRLKGSLSTLACRSGLEELPKIRVGEGEVFNLKMQKPWKQSPGCKDTG